MTQKIEPAQKPTEGNPSGVANGIPWESLREFPSVDFLTDVKSNVFCAKEPKSKSPPPMTM